jgi:hypothetical protein
MSAYQKVKLCPSCNLFLIKNWKSALGKGSSSGNILPWLEGVAWIYFRKLATSTANMKTTRIPYLGTKRTSSRKLGKRSDVFLDSSLGNLQAVLLIGGTKFNYINSLRILLTSATITNHNNIKATKVMCSPTRSSHLKTLWGIIYWPKLLQIKVKMRAIMKTRIWQRMKKRKSYPPSKNKIWCRIKQSGERTANCITSATLQHSWMSWEHRWKYLNQSWIRQTKTLES